MSPFVPQVDARAARAVVAVVVVLLAATVWCASLRPAFADPAPPDPGGSASSAPAGAADAPVQPAALDGARVTVHAVGDRQGDDATALAGTTFQAYRDSGFTNAVAGASCTTDAGGDCELGGLAPFTRYYVRAVATPAPFQVIDTMTTKAEGSIPYGDAVTTGGPGSSTPTRAFVARRTNPPFPGECGLDIALVMDLSNSIDADELVEMKTAARGFVTALQGTPSSVAGFTFATEAPAGGNGDLALTDVSGVSGADQVRAWIDARTEPGDSAGGTNWDAALRQVVPSAAEPDVVVLLTDGNPTFSGDPQNAGNGSDTTFDEVEAGVMSANALKAANPALKVVGVAIGDRAAVDNLESVSGPVLGDDLFLAADFRDLQAKLQELATKLCGGTVTVKKLVDGVDGFRPAGGWTFSVGGATPPTGVTQADTGVTPAFDVAAGTVTITETRQHGYDLVPQRGRHASCTRNGAPVPPSDLTDIDDGISLRVGGLDIVACEFRNRAQPATLRVDKRWLGAAPDEHPHAVVDVSGPSASSTPMSGPAPGTTGTLTVAPGTYTVSESALTSGWDEQSITCTIDDGAPFTPAARGIDVDKGDDVVCVVVNAKRGSITIVKQAQPHSAHEFGFTSSGLGDPFKLRGDGTSASRRTFTGLVAGAYSVTEDAAEPGWELAGVECAGADGAEGGSGAVATRTATVALPPGGDVTCTFVNRGPDVAIEKSDRPDPVAAGGELTYDVVVRNVGPVTASPVVVRDPLPPETTFVRLATDADWSCVTPLVGESGVVTCTRAALAVGATASLSLTVHVASSTPPGRDAIVNTARVTTPGDANPADNDATARTTVERAVDLAITKSDGGAQPVGGIDGFTYTLAVDNRGPSDAASAATVTDVLPAGIEFVEFGALPDGVACDPPEGRTLACTIAPALLAVAAPAVVIPLRVTVPASTPGGRVTNRVIVGNGEDPAPCVVTDVTITCDPADTDNYAEVTTPIVQVEAQVQPPAAPPVPSPRAPALAFTGGGAARLAAVGVTFVALGAALVVLVRRRNHRVRG